MARAIDIKPYQPRKVWDTFTGLDGLQFYQGICPVGDLHPHPFLYPGTVVAEPHRPDVFPGIQRPHGAIWHELGNCGNWRIEGGMARIIISLDYSVAVVRSLISNVWLRIWIRLGANGSRGGICFRARDEDDYWYAVLDDALQQVRLYERAGAAHNLRANQPFAVDESSWYILAVLACDEDIRVFVDRVQVLAHDGEGIKHYVNHGMFLESEESRIDQIIIGKAPPAFPR